MHELAKLLREYAATEHGKRARIHAEISRLVFRNPVALAQAIESYREPMSDDAFKRLAGSLGAKRSET